MKIITILICLFFFLSTSFSMGEQGIASIFSVQSNHGKRTASGVELTDYGDMVAHKSYPFGTKLLITNLKNDKSVIGIVVDRGPYVQGRIVDLTMGVAKLLGLSKKQGLTRVKIRVVGQIKYY